MHRSKRRKLICIIVGIFLVIIGGLAASAYYHLAWAGNAQTVRFESQDIWLHGLLIKPAGSPPFPAVVVLHGSGSADGTHDLPGYRVHANSFLRRGFAVLVYDKRGVGDSEGNFDDAIYDDFVTDALSAVRFLRDRDDINPDQIGLLGASEGGWLTPEVAVTAGNIAFIVNKCGPSVSWKDTVLFEIENDLRANGISDDVIQETIRLRKQIWQYYADTVVDSSLASGSERDQISEALSELIKQASADDLELPAKLPEYDPDEYARIVADVSYDPTPFLQQLDIPLLYTFGGQDINIPTAKCVQALQDLEVDATVRVYPNVGHSLMTWRGIWSGGFTPGYLDLISDWAKQALDVP